MCDQVVPRARRTHPARVRLSCASAATRQITGTVSVGSRNSIGTVARNTGTVAPRPISSSTFQSTA